MAKKTAKTKYAEKGNVDLYYQLTLIGFCLLVFYPPFFKGLFFEVSQQWTLVFASLVFISCCLWQAAKLDFCFFDGPMSYVAFGMPVIYVVSVLVAADARLAVAEVVKYFIYFIVFWVAGQLAEEKDKSTAIILNVVYLSGVLIALVGYLAAVGVLSLTDSFVHGRIYSTLQYPNALAIFLAAIMFLGFWMWLTGDSQRLRLYYAVGNFILMFIFFSTNSRGGFLVLGGMLVLYLIGIPRELRLPWLGHLACILPLSLLCTGTVIPAAYTKHYGSAWLWFIACCAIVAGIHWGWPQAVSRIGLKTVNIPIKKIVALGLICLLIGAGALVLWGSSLDSQALGGNAQQAWYFKVLPAPLAHRISQISLGTRNAQLRIYWSLQAFDIVKESPILGMGGGAWEAYYRTIQDYPYNSTQVHNHFLQLWAEVGTVGLVIYLGLWVLFVVAFWKNYRRSPNSKERLLNLSVFVSGVGIGVHSLIDFDLTLGAIAILLWTCFGLTWGRSVLDGKNIQQNAQKTKPKQTRLFLAGVSALTICFLFLPCSLLVAYSYQKDGVAYAQAGNLAKAESSFVRASKFDPFSSDNFQTLASIKNAQKDKEAAIDYMNKAIEKDPYDFRLFSSLSRIYLSHGDLEGAIKAGEKAAKSAPWTAVAYQSLTNAYAEGGIRCLENNDPEGARKYFEDCVNLPKVLEKQAETIPDNAKKMWSKRTGFYSFTPPIQLTFGISNLYLQHYDLARENLTSAYKDEQSKPDASFWLAVLAKKVGMEEESQKYLQEADKDLVKRFDSMFALTSVLPGE